MIRTTILLAALALGLGSDALAQKQRRGETPSAKSGIPEPLQRFDANGDGALDDAERRAVRAWIDARRGERGADGERERRGRRRAEGRPRKGDGTPPRPARSERRDDVRKRLLERFDANGDGVLDAAEREAAREAIRGARGGRGRGTPPGERGRRGRGTPPAERGGRETPRGRRRGEGGPPERGGRRGDAPPTPRRGRGAGELPPALERFDANGDGRLDDAERAALRKEIGGRRGGLPPRREPAPRPRGGARD